jgi:WD40 repeat protein
VLVREWDGLGGNGLVIPNLFSAEGTKLFASIVSGGTASLRELDIATGRETRSLNYPAAVQSRRSVGVSPDRTQVFLVTPGAEDSVRLDLASGRFITRQLNMLQVNPLTVSPDGKLLVVPSSMGYAKVFDTATYGEMTTLSGFMFGVHGAGYSPDQQRLVIGSTAFEALTVWDVHNYERLLTLPAAWGGLGQVAFSPDGNVIAGGSSTMHFWRAPSWAEIEKAEAAEAAKAAIKAGL